jgi:hypothetical protein
LDLATASLSCARHSSRKGAILRLLDRIAEMHFRLPSFDRGVTSFLWALGLALYIWVGMLAVGVDGAIALIVAFLSLFGIFIFVRLFGGDDVRG